TDPARDLAYVRLGRGVVEQGGHCAGDGGCAPWVHINSTIGLEATYVTIHVRQDGGGTGPNVRGHQRTPAACSRALTRRPGGCARSTTLPVEGGLHSQRLGGLHALAGD